MTDTASLVAQAQQYIEWTPNAAEKVAVQKMLAQLETHQEALEKSMMKRISFGTAGLRAAMKPGFAYMNDLIVLQTSQGLCRHLQATLGKDVVAKQGIVIGYDGRYNSKRFAEITAAVFLSEKIKVYVFSKEYAATPFVPFAMQFYKAVSGVMVTASHNPKDDNGYKVYGPNACQITDETGIAQRITENLCPWPAVDTSLTFEDISKHELLVECTEAATDAYYKDIKTRMLWTPEANGDPAYNCNITYTAMHGVGYQWCVRAFEEFGLPALVPTEEQIRPDPEFPTVAFPNPEEGKGALKLAMETAIRNDSKVVLANDPDADRLAIAEQQPDGSWKVFNGNEIGILLASWVWKQIKNAHPEWEPSSCAVVSTAVSSKMLKAMAEAEGFQFHECLTGFKWIGNKASELVNAGLHFLFGYEEAIGFMVGMTCLDKDGVRAAVVAAEFVRDLYHQKSSLQAHLESLYAKYGYFCISTKYFFCYDPNVMEGIFNSFRSGGEAGAYKWSLGEYKIKSIRDQTTGYDSSEPDQKTKLPVTPTGQMITIIFENGCVATVRGSGTEPKLKYYVEMCGKPGQSKGEVEEMHGKMSTAIVQHILQPEKNGLVSPKSS